MKNYRKKELEKFKMIWLTKEGYELLRVQKKAQKKSMMRIIDNLIKDKYEQDNREPN